MPKSLKISLSVSPNVTFFQVISGSSEESESVPFIDDDSSESSSKDKTDNATAVVAPIVSLDSTVTATALPKPTFLDLKSGENLMHLKFVNTQFA